MTATPPWATTQWYRLVRGVPTPVSDDEAYQHRGSCYDTWSAARADAIRYAEEAYTAAIMNASDALAHRVAMLLLPETDPHA